MVSLPLHPEIAWRPAFPQRYMVFLTLALLDLVQTCFIISIGGGESNEIALWVMRHWGVAGAAVFKFGLAVGVIGLTEYIVRRDGLAGRRLANYSVIIGALPVAFGLMLLAVDAAFHG